MNLQNTVKNKAVSLELVGFEQHTYFFFAVPDNLYETVEGLLYSAYPDCEIKQVDDYVDNFTRSNLQIAGARLQLRFGDIYPFKTYDEFEEDSQSRLFSVISKIATGEQVWIQIVINPQEESSGYHLSRRVGLRWNQFKKGFSVRDWMRLKEENSVIN
ncbi:MAG: hypothetical protein KBD78_16915, partial [Oligoflexales bacterium]|nr:hypothetical protein [Oligoflexales bacterium]